MNETKYMLGVAFCLMVIVFAAGCIGATATDGTDKSVSTHTELVWAENIRTPTGAYTDWSMGKVYMQKENTTCFLSDGPYSGGISCTPGKI